MSIFTKQPEQKAQNKPEQKADTKFAKDEKPINLMTIKYLLALIMFAVLSFDGFLIVQGSLKSTQLNFNRISISENQKVLFMKSVLLAEQVGSVENVKKRWKFRTKLIEVIDDFEKSHNALVNGDRSLHLPYTSSPEVNKIYYEPPISLDSHAKNYIKAVRYLIKHSDSQEPGKSDALRYIGEIKKSQRVINALNALIRQYVKENDSQVKTIQNNENMVFASTVFVIIIAGLFIFQPMVQQVKRSFKHLEELNETLEERVKERTQELTRLAESLKAEIEVRIKTEEELRKSEELFRLITENMADLVAVLDLQGRRLYNNPAYKKIFGEPGLQTGTDSFAEIHPDDKEKIREAFNKVVTTGMPQRAEYRFSLGNGKISHIESVGSAINNASGKTEFVIVVARDITERRLKEGLVS